MKLKTNVISTQKALDQLKIESVEKTSKIEALKMTNFRWNAELASTQDALEETRVECVENRSEIQALRIAKIKLETEVTSAQKALEESKAESKAESKVELEKVEKLELVFKELNHFGVIADLFRQIGGHTRIMVI